jgi:hypothetical protein
MIFIHNFHTFTSIRVIFDIANLTLRRCDFHEIPSNKNVTWIEGENEFLTIISAYPDHSRQIWH